MEELKEHFQNRLLMWSKDYKIVRYWNGSFHRCFRQQLKMIKDIDKALVYIKICFETLSRMKRRAVVFFESTVEDMLDFQAEDVLKMVNELECGLLDYELKVMRAALSTSESDSGKKSPKEKIALIDNCDTFRHRRPGAREFFKLARNFRAYQSYKNVIAFQEDNDRAERLYFKLIKDDTIEVSKKVDTLLHWIKLDYLKRRRALQDWACVLRKSFVVLENHVVNMGELWDLRENAIEKLELDRTTVPKTRFEKGERTMKFEGDHTDTNIC